MADFAPLTILINTYNRLDGLESTIDHLLAHLYYPEHLLSWVIADDCSRGNYLDRIDRMTRKFQALMSNLRILSTPVNSGWAAASNYALAQIDTSYVYHTDDDFMLMRHLDLRIGVALLECEPTIGMVRYAALACNEKYVYRQHESDVSAYLKHARVSGDGALQGRLIYLTLDKSSPSLYLYSQTPLVYARRKWFDYYGAFPEGVTLGECEEKYCHHVKDNMNADDSAPMIAVLPEWIPMHYRIQRAFSWQHTDVDKQRAVHTQ